MTPKISAIVCTYNRAEILPKVLDSLINQSLPTEQYEIIVVDNASVDRTREIVQEYQGGSTAMRYVYEPKQGVSAARNRGIKESRAKILAFIDDDAVADEHWLEEHYKAYESEPDLSAVGGKIDLLWSTPRPSWFCQEFEKSYGKFNPEPEPVLLRFPLYPFGGNFSAKRASFFQAGMFSEHLGRVGTRLLSGEEAEFFYRLSQLNAKVFYQPKAMVRHRVAPERLSISWILKSKFESGATSAIYSELICDNKRRGRYFIRSAQEGLEFIFFVLKVPAAFILRGREAKVFLRVTVTVRALGRCYQHVRMAFKID